MNNKLSSNLLVPGTKFVVSGDIKDSTFGPGSMGVMAYIKMADPDYENVAKALVVIIRRGKTGMMRLNSNTLSFPIFYDKRMLTHKNYLPNGRKYHVNIKKISYEIDDLLEMSPIEFLAWITAKIMYIKHLALELSYPNSKKVLSKSPDSLLNMGARLPEYFHNDPTNTLKHYAEMEWRRQNIRTIRHKESALVRCALLYEKKVADMALNSAEFVHYTNTEYYEVTGKIKSKATIEYYHNKVKMILGLIDNKDIIVNDIYNSVAGE